MEQAADRFLRVMAITGDALATSEETRPAFVDTQCGEDMLLAAEVRSLLNACETEERLTTSRRSRPIRENCGRKHGKPVGPYELDCLLGRGGMGAVYLAHRADGQFEQQVAVKLIELPVATNLFEERFRQERQILAGLQHPYIARLLDGGVTAEGNLFLAMEYVNGIPVHRFCEERALSAAQRIELFLRVCEAVQFAHQNFVVHRDLKPDNILVVEDGTPRLLDFGTAKLISPSLDKQDSQLTRAGYLSFTPQYASPEQVLGNPITTASDTYSLGVLLYLILTGVLPYEFEELTTAEMLRAVCEEAPRKPSLAGGKRLGGDLEAILLKALRKEPQQRYLTAEQFARDLRAYLEGLPVAARRGTVRYRTSKFLRRHRWGIAAAALLAATLIAGVVGVAWQATVANQERRKAEMEQRKAEARTADVRQLSNSLLSELDVAIQKIPGSTNARKLLITRVLEHLDRMANDAQDDRRTQLDLMDAYTRLASVQGNVLDQNLGDTAGALVSIDKAIALGTPLAGGDSRDREALRALASAELCRGDILDRTGRLPEEMAVTRAAISTYERLLAIPGAAPGEIVDTAYAYIRLGREQIPFNTNSVADMAGALAAYRKSLELMNRALHIDPGFRPAKEGVYNVQASIGMIELETDPAQALKDFQIASQRFANLPEEEQSTLQTIVGRQALLEFKAYAQDFLGEHSEANAILAGLLQSKQRLVAADPQDLRALDGLQGTLNAIAYVSAMAADPAQGATAGTRSRYLIAEEKALTQEVSVYERMLKLAPARDETNLNLAYAQVDLGSVQSILHHGSDPAALVSRGLAVLRERATRDHVPPLVLNIVATQFLTAEPASLRDLPFAISCAQRAVASSRHQVPSYLLVLARTYRAAGEKEKSRAAAKEGLSLLAAFHSGDVKPRIRKMLEIQASE